MPKEKPTWEEITEFSEMAKKVADKYTELFSKVEVDKIICYGSDKEPNELKAKKYDMAGIGEPEVFTNTKQYFVKLPKVVWDEKSENQKLALVFECLDRVDTDNPGKVKPLDFRARSVMVRSFGADYDEREDLPNLLNEDVNIRY